MNTIVCINSKDTICAMQLFFSPSETQTMLNMDILSQLLSKENHRNNKV